MPPPTPAPRRIPPAEAAAKFARMRSRTAAATPEPEPAAAPQTPPPATPSATPSATAPPATLTDTILATMTSDDDANPMRHVGNIDKIAQLKIRYPDTFAAAWDAALATKIETTGTGADRLQADMEAAATYDPDADDGLDDSFDVANLQDASPLTAAKSGEPYACTDLGNAERLTCNHRDEIRYNPARGWIVWDGTRWVPDATLQIYARAALTSRSIRTEANAMPTDSEACKERAQAMFAWAVKSESRERMSAMVDVARSQPGIVLGVSEIDRDPWVLNCASGTIDLRTGKLRPHDRNDRITKLSPVDYKPGHKDPRFDTFLTDATGDDTELARWLQKLCGYILTGDTSEEKAFFWYGGTSTGKSTLLEALRTCLGDYARTIDPAMLCRQRRQSGSATPELAMLQGVRLASGSELEDGQQLGEAFFKSLTGGEGITARHLYGHQFEFSPQFKIVLALNHCPRASSDDPAIWRRLIRVGIDRTVPPERLDKTLKPYLRDPKGGAPAVLAWAVEGCIMWQREGLYPLPESVVKTTEEYKVSCDPLAAFFDDCISLNRYAWTSTSDIMESYHEHAEHLGTPERYRVSARRISDKLRDLGAESERRHTGRGWQGVEIKDVTDKA